MQPEVYSKRAPRKRPKFDFATAQFCLLLHPSLCPLSCNAGAAPGGADGQVQGHHPEQPGALHPAGAGAGGPGPGARREGPPAAAAAGTVGVLEPLAGLVWLPALFGRAGEGERRESQKYQCLVLDLFLQESEAEAQAKLHMVQQELEQRARQLTEALDAATAERNQLQEQRTLWMATHCPVVLAGTLTSLGGK